MSEDKYTNENDYEENRELEDSYANENTGDGYRLIYSKDHGYYNYDGSLPHYYGSKEKKEEPAPKKKRGAAAIALVLAAVIGITGIAGGLAYSHRTGSVTRGSVAQSTASAKEGSAGSSETKLILASSAAEAAPAETENKESSGKVATTSEVKAVVTDVSDVVEKAMPAIVSVYNTFRQDINWFGRTYTQEAQGTGSGIIIGENDEELLIVTNHHVVDGEESLEVQFTDQKNAAATLKGSDPDNDLAVISVKISDLEKDTLDKIAVAEIGDSDALRIGEPAIAIGNALGYGQSVTLGVISAKDREMVMEDGSGGVFIQTDAAINRGNSGGALLNSKGEVIGINSSKLGGTAVEGMGFAIPMSRAIPIIEELMNLESRDKVEDEKRGAIGINGVTVTADVASAYSMPRGAYVAQILADTGAAESDLQKGDIITEINNVRVQSMTDLQKRLEYYAAGETVTLTVQRPAEGGEYEEISVDVVLSERKGLESQSGSEKEGSSDSSEGGSENRPGRNDGNNGNSDNGFGFYFPFPFGFGF